MTAPAAQPQSETQERILTAALAAFAEQGFEGAKTRDIADRAGVKLGLLQYHFGSKQMLWRAAVDRAFADMREGLEGVLASDAFASERERLRALLRGHVHFVAERPEFVWLMHEEGKRRGERTRWLIDRHVKPIFELFVPVIARAQRAGDLPAELDPVHLVYALIGATTVIFHQAEECRRVTGVDPFGPDAIEQHLRTVETLFLGAAPTEKTP